MASDKHITKLQAHLKKLRTQVHSLQKRLEKNQKALRVAKMLLEGKVISGE